MDETDEFVSNTENSDKLNLVFFGLILGGFCPFFGLSI